MVSTISSPVSLSPLQYTPDHLRMYVHTTALMRACLLRAAVDLLSAMLDFAGSNGKAALHVRWRPWEEAERVADETLQRASDALPWRRSLRARER